MIAIGSFLEVFSIFMLSLVHEGQYYQVGHLNDSCVPDEHFHLTPQQFYPCRCFLLKRSESGLDKLCFSFLPSRSFPNTSKGDVRSPSALPSRYISFRFLLLRAYRKLNYERMINEYSRVLLSVESSGQSFSTSWTKKRRLVTRTAPQEQSRECCCSVRIC